MIIISEDTYGNNHCLKMALGKVVKSANVKEDVVSLTFADGSSIEIEPVEDFSVVHLEDITGDLSDLVGHPLAQAEVVAKEGGTPDPSTYLDTSTWTFTKLASLGGYVTIRYYGASNGYYAEGVKITYDDGVNDLLPCGRQKVDRISSYKGRTPYNY